jgi:hypothetical protein
MQRSKQCWDHRKSEEEVASATLFGFGTAVPHEQDRDTRKVCGERCAMAQKHTRCVVLIGMCPTESELATFMGSEQLWS